MKTRARVLCCLITALFLFLLLGGTSQAASGFAGGNPWQIGDIIVCVGGGTCNVLRIVNGTPTLLDQFSDGLLGDTRGVAINNTLHLLVADAVGGSASDVVEYTIASVNPQTGVAVAHQLATNSPFNGGGANGQALAVNNSGQIFVGNAGNGATGPSITELDPNGQKSTAASVPPLVLPSNPFMLPASCLDNNPPTQLSMDLSAAGDALYLTSSGGTVRKLTFASAGSGCTTFANFGSNVTLYGIKDIPSGALANVSPNCKGTTCPADEALLVVAIGNTDPDSGETADNDAVNICTNVVDNNPVSCALLLDTNTNPGLNYPLWQASNLYSLNTTILDPTLHLQTTYTLGTSSKDEPQFSQTNGTILDNAVIWTNQGQPGWIKNNAYSVVAPALPTPGTYIVDSNFNLQTVTTAGTSGPGPNHPAWSNQTVDGLQWTDQGQSLRAPNTLYPTTAVLISDPSTHAQQVFQAGRSGAGALPARGWNDGGGQTIEGVTWKESHPTWSPGSVYAVGALVMDQNNHVQQVQQAGTSGAGPAPNFTQGGTTNDNTVTWVDIGQAVWRPSFSYGLNALIVDAGGHVQQAASPGTAGPNPPTFVDGNSPGGSVTDGLQWLQTGSTVCTGSCPLWLPATQYSAGNSITDNSGKVWNATSGGTSGAAANRPPFEANPNAGTVLADNAIVWTDEGLLNNNTNFTWQPSKAYVVSAEVIDGNQHVELVTVAGTSGPGPSAPAFVDGGTVVDGSNNAVIWADLGQAVWRANFSYGLGAIIVDANGNVQQVTAAGTTGPAQPNFPGSSTGTQTIDGTAVWTNQGALLGSHFNWTAGFQYGWNAMIVDSNNHVELAINAGQSGAGPNQPAFADGGSVVDGLIWADQLQPAWIHDTAYALTGVFIVDTNNNLETVFVPGTSGPQPPSWQLSGTTIDGLMWADQGAWLGGHPYFTLGQPVGDSNGHVHTVATTGTSGLAQPTWNDNLGNNGGLTSAGITIDNAVIWSEWQKTWQPNHTYTVGMPDTLIVDSNHDVELVTNNNPHSVGLSAISGPSQPSGAGHNPWSMTVTGQTIDGLQWQNSSATSSVVARYPVAGTTTLQSLTLSPLIEDCTVVNCSSGLPTATTSNFWLADSQSANFYKLDFATGTPITYNANLPCASCATVTRIQGIGIYGGEGSNQPHLAKLFSGSLKSGNSGSTPPPGSTAQVQFPPADADKNTWTLTPYNVPSNQQPVLTTLYASLIPNGVVFPKGNNSGATDPSAVGSTGSPIGIVGCQPTTSDPTKCIIWKADLTIPSGSYLSEVVSAPGTLIDNGTDLFVDLHYDITSSTAFSDLSTSGGSKGSVHSLQEITTQFNNANSGCAYSSPVENTCYKSNRGTLNFTFQCSGLTHPEFLNLQNPPGPPALALVERFPNVNPKPAPETIFVSGTNSKGPYRYDAPSNSYIFQWSISQAESSGQINPNANSTIRGCTFDPTGTVQTFCVDFTLSPTCK